MQQLSHPALPPAYSGTLSCLTPPLWRCLLLGRFLPGSRVLPQSVLVPGRPLHGCRPASPVPLSLCVGPRTLGPALRLGSLLVLLKEVFWIAKGHYIDNTLVFGSENIFTPQLLLV